MPTLGQVLVDRPCTRRCRSGRSPAKPYVIAGSKRARVDPVDDLADALQRLGARVEVAAEHLRADGDDDDLAVLRLVVAVGVAVGGRLPRCRSRFLMLAASMRRRRVVVVEQRARRLGDLVVVAGLDVVAQLLELRPARRRARRAARGTAAPRARRSRRCRPTAGRACLISGTSASAALRSASRASCPGRPRARRRASRRRPSWRRRGRAPARSGGTRAGATRSPCAP